MTTAAAVGVWLDRYRRPATLRDGRHFELVSAVREADREGCLVVRPGPEAEPARARRALAALAEAHGAIVHPAVPRLGHASLEGEPLFVELACEVAIDVAGLARALSERRQRMPYAQLLVLREALLDAMAAAHATGRALGRLALADVWLSADGLPSILGWGAHVTLERDDGSVDASLAALEAPEVAMGMPATPASDLVLAHLFSRALASVVEPPPALARVWTGAANADPAIREAALALDRAVLAAVPHERPSFDEGRAAMSALDRLLGVAPDPEGLARTVESTLVRSAEHDVPTLALTEPTERNVAVDGGGAWVDSEQGRAKLGPSLRAILAHLLEQRRVSPGRTTSLWELLEIGWPGEQPLPDSGANRVYAAISRLRRMGLLGALEWHEGGYRIAPGAPITTIE